MAELVDARVLGTRIFGCGSSSLPDRIFWGYINICIDKFFKNNTYLITKKCDSNDENGNILNSNKKNYLPWKCKKKQQLNLEKI